MVDFLIEHFIFTLFVWILITLFISILNMINYRKKKCYERVIFSLIGNDEEIFELCKEAAKLGKQDVKANVFGAEQKGKVAEAMRQVKARGTAAERKQDNDFRRQEIRLESIVKLANINRRQILDYLSKKK